MGHDSLSDAKIVDSWRKNALPWIKVVREGQIKSRRQSTDRAIIDAVLSCSPKSVIDLGCGEGWLCRFLAEQGIEVLGIDAVPELIIAARSAGGGGDFRLLTYDEVVSGKCRARADAAVCNFSLLGKTSVEGLIGIVPSLLNSRGSLVVQTLHPSV
jgi:2-polyprenyl-3-methyl-5-hydroxy-6-metoxy-1,4-benzoquinol methylase